MSTRSTKFAKTISDYFQKQQSFSKESLLLDKRIGILSNFSNSKKDLLNEEKNSQFRKIEKLPSPSRILRVASDQASSSIRHRENRSVLRCRKASFYGSKNQVASGEATSLRQGKKEKTEFSTSYSKISKIEYISIGLASSETIRNWAEKRLPNGKILGEVKSANTLHHKTFKPLKGGLFCERIFGPCRDFECSCGIQKFPSDDDYQKIIQHKKVKRKFCPVCDVEYTWSIIRRYQLGYIQLSSPVSHIWYLKSNPSYLAILLDFKKSVLEKIIYCTESLTLENSRKMINHYNFSKGPTELYLLWEGSQKTFNQVFHNNSLLFPLGAKGRILKAKKHNKENKRVSINNQSLRLEKKHHFFKNQKQSSKLQLKIDNSSPEATSIIDRELRANPQTLAEKLHSPGEATLLRQKQPHASGEKLFPPSKMNSEKIFIFKFENSTKQNFYKSLSQKTHKLENFLEFKVLKKQKKLIYETYNFNFIRLSLSLFKNLFSIDANPKTEKKYLYILFLVLKHLKSLKLFSKSDSKIRSTIIQVFKTYKNLSQNNLLIPNPSFYLNDYNKKDQFQFLDFSIEKEENQSQERASQSLIKSFAAARQVFASVKTQFKKIEFNSLDENSVFDQDSLASYKGKLLNLNIKKLYKEDFSKVSLIMKQSNFQVQILKNLKLLDNKEFIKSLLLSYFLEYLTSFIWKIQFKNKFKTISRKANTLNFLDYKDRSKLLNSDSSSKDRDLGSKNFSHVLLEGERCIKMFQEFRIFISSESRKSNFQTPRSKIESEAQFFSDKKRYFNSWKFNSAFYLNDSQLKERRKFFLNSFVNNEMLSVSDLLRIRNLFNKYKYESLIQIQGISIYSMSFNIPNFIKRIFISKFKNFRKDSVSNLGETMKLKNKSKSKKLNKKIFLWKNSYFLSHFYKNLNSVSEDNTIQKSLLKLFLSQKNFSNKVRQCLLKTRIFSKCYKTTQISSTFLFLKYFQTRSKKTLLTENFPTLKLKSGLEVKLFITALNEKNEKTEFNKSILRKNQFGYSIELNKQSRSLYLSNKKFRSFVFDNEKNSINRKKRQKISSIEDRKEFLTFNEKTKINKQSLRPPKFQNPIYSLSFREAWASDRDWHYFSYYTLAPRLLEDFSIPIYKSRGFEEASRTLSDIEKRINIGSQIVQKLLLEFDSSELQKMDQQNQIILHNFNKKIQILKTFVKKGLAEKSQINELKKLCKTRDHLLAKTKLIRKLFLKNTDASSMMLTTLPVLPPDLRPILKLQGQIAASDLNRLYQRILFRNDRLYRFRHTLSFVDLFPLKFCQKLLQEAVDNLIQNGKGGVLPERDSRGRPLKSLSEILKGKQGRFRQYLLGKRVDYSGRSVIVVGPKLKLHECGLPKEIAMELFQPFLLKRILHYKLAQTIIGAKTLIQSTQPHQVNLCLFLLSELMQSHPILLNRAPTLHRLGFQAFQPKLIEGRAILLHPLVCPAFNADFDGDQMAVHLPLTVEACAESWKLMFARNHLISSATGDPILLPSQDMVLGCYYLTNEVLKFSNLSQSKIENSVPKSFTTSDLSLTSQNLSLNNINNNIDMKNFKNNEQYFTSRKPDFDFYGNKVFEKINSMLSQNDKSFKDSKNQNIENNHSRTFNRYFNNLTQVMKSYQRQTLEVHSDIWVKWEKSVEIVPGKYFLPGKASVLNHRLSQAFPLEIRVNLDGSWQEIRLKQLRRFGKNNIQMNQYIRTTPGRVLFHEIVTNCMK